MVDTELTSRLNRAKQQHRSFDIIDRDPYVIRMEGSNGDYTIVPNVAYCSCQDRQYRQLPCKHILQLALLRRDDDIGRATRAGIAHETDEINEEIDEHEQRLDTLRRRLETWNEAVHTFDIDEEFDGDPSYREPTDIGTLDAEPEAQYDSIEAWLDELDRDADHVEEWERFHDRDEDETIRIPTVFSLDPDTAQEDDDVETDDEITQMARTASSDPERPKPDPDTDHWG